MMIKRFKVSKLMRDKTPQWMESKGIKYSISKVVPESVLKHLYLKLDEEVKELLFFSKDQHLSKSEANHNIMDEMADVLEVLQSIAQEKNIKWEDVQSWKEKKLGEQGGFKKGIHVNWIEASEENEIFKHYEKNHDHPEISKHEYHTSGHSSKDDEHHEDHKTKHHDHKKEAHGERHHDHDHDHHDHYDHDY